MKTLNILCRKIRNAKTSVQIPSLSLQCEMISLKLSGWFFVHSLLCPLLEELNFTELKGKNGMYHSPIKAMGLIVYIENCLSLTTKLT